MLQSFHHTRSTKQQQITSSEYYQSHRWLDPEDSHCNPDQYFKEISYFIDLNDIYDYIDTCYFNDDMPFCPVLVKLSQERIINSFNGCNYLLQVWEKASQRKSYELPMKTKIKKWSIMYKYLLFILEDDATTIHIVDLESKNTTMKVKNFALDIEIKHISLSGEYLYVASDYDLHVLHLPSICSSEGQVIDISQGQAKTRVFKTPLRILALVMNGLAKTNKFQPIAFESKDNQLEYSKIVLNNFSDDSNFSYSWEIMREMMPRNVKDDPITSFKFTYVGGYMFGVSLRESGDCDLYWNFMHKAEVEKNHQNSAAITFDWSVEIFEKDFNFKKIYMKIIQNIIKPYVGFNILRTNNTGTIVVLAHATFISLYNILEQRWVNHCQYEDEILYLFRHYLNDKDKYQAIILRNGATYVGVLNNDMLLDNVPTSKRQAKFEGQMVRISQDIENNNILFCLIKQEGQKLRLEALVRGKIQSINVVANIEESLSVVQFQCRGANTKVLIQNGKNLALYSTTIKDEKVTLDQIRILNNIGESFKDNKLHTGCSYDITQHMFLFDEKNMYVVLFKERDQHVVRKYENVFCCGIQTITNNFNYALCQETATSTCPGLRYFDMELIIKKDKPMMTLLKKIDVGTNGYFEQGVTIERLGFLNSINSLVVCPILHRNTIRYMGLKPANDYQLFNPVNGKFLALIGQSLQSYCQFTGKFESAYEIPKHIIDMSKLKFGDRKKYGRALFVSNEDVKVEKEEEFYFDWQLQKSTENQKTFQEAVVKTYKKYYYLELISPKEIKIHLEFIHPHYGYQRVYFNKDMDKMINILLNYRTFVYKKVNVDPSDETKFKWEVIRCIKSYPNDLDNDPKFLEFFSPCFTRYLAVDQKVGQYVIRNVDDGEEVQRIPKEILTPDKKAENVKHSTNRIQWLQLDRMRICNTDGVEMIFDLSRNFKRLAYNKIPLFGEITNDEWLTHHIYKERPPLTSDQLIQRLKRRYQAYKSRYMLTENPTLDDLLSELFHRDVQNAQFAEQPLTFVHWSLINQLKNDIITLDDLSAEVIETLIYNILPGGNTLIHAISNKKEQFNQLLEMCHEDGKIKIHVPFLANLEGETAIHQMVNKRNYKSINTMLKHLSYYDIDHHSRWIKDLYSKFVENELPNFIPYMESRFIQTKQIKALDRGPLKEDHPESFVTQLWFKNNIIDETLYDLSEGAHLSNFKVQYLDMPGSYHCMSPDFKKLFGHLAETQNYDYFDSKAIQTIIDFNYHLVKERIIQLIVYPFLVFHICFVVYTNVIYIGREGNDQLAIADWIFSLILLGFSLYFFVYEMTQIMSQGIVYIYSIWNYIDLLAPIGVIIFWILQFTEKQGAQVNITLYRTILALSTFFMWLKILYILRIFKPTGYLIRAIVEVIYDMRIFLLILFMTACTFGDSFLKLSLGNAEDQRFISNFPLAIMYGYRMILGDFDTSEFGEVGVPLAWVFFTLCTILDMIVMLNLLIAIISDTYARVANNAEQASYQEMAKLIDENMYLVQRSVKETYAPQNQYILVVENLEKISYTLEDPLFDKIRDVIVKVQTSVDQQNEKNSKNNKNLNESIKELMEKVKTVNEEQATIKKIVGEIKDKAITGVSSASNGQSSSDPRKVEGNYRALSVHNHAVIEYSLKQLTEQNENIKSFRCDGRHINGCPSKIVDEKNVNVGLYHCFTCGIDVCIGCYQGNKIKHCHALKQVTFSEIINLKQYEATQQFSCFLASQKGCHYGSDKVFNSPQDVTYCCRACDVDFCDKCVQKFWI